MNDKSTAIRSAGISRGRARAESVVYSRLLVVLLSLVLLQNGLVQAQEFPPLGPEFDGFEPGARRQMQWRSDGFTGGVFGADRDLSEDRPLRERGMSRTWRSGRDGRGNRELGGDSGWDSRSWVRPVSRDGSSNRDAFPERAWPVFDLRSPVREQGSDFPQLRELVPQLNWGAPGGAGGTQQQLPVPDSDVELNRKRIAARYQDPTVLRFVRSLSYTRSLELFDEVSRLIDSRHIEPLPYADRFRQGAANLVLAMSTPSFVSATGLRSAFNSASTSSLAAGWERRAQQVSTRADCVAAIRAVMDEAYRQTNLHPSYVGMEFVFASAEVHDKYSAFEPDEPQRAPSAALEDHVVGVGIEIQAHESGAEVGRVLEGGPAQRAGLKRGDVILSIDGWACRGNSLAQIADRISGAIGTSVSMEVQRGGSRGVLSMVRSRVKVQSISDVALIDRENGVGYLRLHRFSQTSTQELDQALWSLHRQGMKSLVMDVRGNPGGLLTAAIEISDRFLPCGTIVSTRGRLAEDSSNSAAKFEQTWRTPLVVLIDNDSASASEIFAAAIQENRRGIVVGERSYGKGTVQTHFPLRTVSGTLRLTTARFYSPGGQPMAGRGVTPDLPVSGGSVSRGTIEADPVVQRAIRVATSDVAAEMAESGPACRSGSSMLIGGVN